MQKSTAIVLTHGMLESMNAKTCHGLLRGTERFEIRAVIDYRHAGQDAGEVMDGRRRNIPIFAGVKDYLAAGLPTPRYCIVGVALEGGLLPDNFRMELYQAMEGGMSIICGLHTLLSEDPEFSRRANENGVGLIDVRKPRPTSELSFWTGEIFQVLTPRIAVLGMDCAVGKRTTCRFLMEACLEHGVKAEMIYTGQTGWMQGYKHGFIFDSTINDFISGEIERVIVECERESQPDLILVEGQSAMRNPSGPCGAEFIVSGDIKGVILQHIPGRRLYDDNSTWNVPIPSVESEIALYALYGAEVLAVTLNEEGMKDEAIEKYRRELEDKLGIPVIRPLKEGMGRLVPVVKDYMGRKSI